MKLHQLLAVMAGKKTQVQDELTRLYRETAATQESAFRGLVRSYTPLDEEGEQLPSEQQFVQRRAYRLLSEFCDLAQGLCELVARQDLTNCEAKAPIVLHADTVVQVQLTDPLPVSTLLYLEKRFSDLLTFVSQLPVLPADREWRFDDAANCYVTAPVTTMRTKKVLKNHVRAEATDKHPAQVDTYTEDVTIGTWRKVDHSGAIPVSQRDAIVRQVQAISDAIKLAREQANTAEVVAVVPLSKLFTSVLDAT